MSRVRKLRRRNKQQDVCGKKIVRHNKLAGRTGHIHCKKTRKTKGNLEISLRYFGNHLSMYTVVKPQNEAAALHDVYYDTHEEMIGGDT